MPQERLVFLICLIYNKDVGFSPVNGLGVHEGGNNKMVAAYTSRGNGVVREVDASSFNNPPQQYSDEYHCFISKNIIWYNVGEDLVNINVIKTALMEHGAIVTNISYKNAFIDDYYNFYQPYYDDNEPNHAVTIIGWDDGRITGAPKRGAWICKNSWGAAWGNNGYFWVSYYDKNACRNPKYGAVQFVGVEPFIADSVYSYDYHGRADTMTSAKLVMNHFKAANSEIIKSVGFYTLRDSVDYSINIYKSFENNILSNQVYSYFGYMKYSGYHNVDLVSAVHVNRFDDYYVVLNIEGDEYAYDRSHIIDVVMNHTTSESFVASVADVNQSYYKHSGQWKDLYYYDDPSGYQNTGNFCINTYNVRDFSTDNASLNTFIPKLSVVDGNVCLENEILNDRVYIILYSIEGRLLFEEMIKSNVSSHLTKITNILKNNKFVIYQMVYKNSWYSGKLVL